MLRDRLSQRSRYSRWGGNALESGGRSAGEREQGPKGTMTAALEPQGQPPSGQLGVVHSASMPW